MLSRQWPLINGLDLFSGIAGITLALEPWVRPIAYCEIDPYCRSVLLSRMAEGNLPRAPIWDDVRTLSGFVLPAVDIIYGGFPCQDISIAGLGKGMAGERSSLFGEIMRLADETGATFLFLENVPAIRTRGLAQVVWELASRGYAARWDCLAAYDVGAPHKRERWWLLAYRRSERLEEHAKRDRKTKQASRKLGENSYGFRNTVPDADGQGLEIKRQQSTRKKQSAIERGNPFMHQNWWTIEPDVGRVAHGVPKRVDRLRALGNSVVPAQAREAFIRLMGTS